MSLKSLEQAIDTKLRGDATLVTLCGQGIWNTARPDVQVMDSTKVLAWATFRIYSGGDANDATGGRWFNVLVLAGGHALADAGPSAALAIDARIETLLHGWVPGLPGAWKAQRETTIEQTDEEGGRVLEYATGALYRFQYGV